MNILEENAQKLTYLAQQYPEHDLKGLLGLLVMPPINMNTAIWKAVEHGWLAEPDKKTGEVKVLATPEHWEFGELVENLMDLLVYAFTALAKQETDLEDFDVSHWTQGYPSHDVLVAMKRLLDKGILAQYDVDDVEDNGTVNTYTFYTLAENAEKQWGRKQFKTDPLANRRKGKK